MLAATWNWRAVFAGVEAVHDRVVQFGVSPMAGFASFSEETKSPDKAKPVSMCVLKPASVWTPPVSGVDQTVPLVAPETRAPPVYTLAPVVAVPLRVSA